MNISIAKATAENCGMFDVLDMVLIQDNDPTKFELGYLLKFHHKERLVIKWVWISP